MLATAARSTRRSHAIAALVAAGVAAGALALGAGPAAAAPQPTTAKACVIAKGDVARLCVRMHRTGLRVHWMEFVRSKRGGGTIRDHHTEVSLWTSTPAGDTATTLVGAHSDGVVRGRVRVRQRVGLSLAPRTDVCGSFFERGEVQGTICFRLQAPRKRTAAA